MTQERTVHPQFIALNSLIKEARHNSQISRQFGETDPNDPLGINSPEHLIRHLAMQAPNRIYCGPDWQIVRVFFYRGEFTYEAYMETLATKPSEPSGFEIAGGEFLSSSTPENLERDVIHWKTKWGAVRDLLHTPERVLASQTRAGEMVHLAGEAYCRYHMSPLLGPRMLDLGHGEYKAGPEEQFAKLPTPPRDLIAYAHPF